LGNSRGGFPLPCSQFVITYCNQSFPSPWHCLSTAPPDLVLSSCPLSRAFPYPQPRDAGGHSCAPGICQSLTSADPISVVHVEHKCKLMESEISAVCSDNELTRLGTCTSAVIVISTVSHCSPHNS